MDTVLSLVYGLSPDYPSVIKALNHHMLLRTLFSGVYFFNNLHTIQKKFVPSHNCAKT
jgi:hypothetical protein